MSFKKNLFTVLLATFLVLIGCWLVGIEPIKIVDGMTLVIATMVMTLLIEDFWRKALMEKELLTWQYFVGAALVSGSVLAWLWTIESFTIQEMVVRLVATFLLAGMGGIWMAIPYRNSVQPRDERDAIKLAKYEASEQQKWERWSRKAQKAQTDDAVDYLCAHLRFHTVGDTIDGALDFARPLAIVGEEALTLNEFEEKGVDPSLAAQIRTYIVSLVKE